MPEYGMETSPLALQAKVENASNCMKAYVYSFLGLTGATTGTR
jgi:hypothetical protein